MYRQEGLPTLTNLLQTSCVSRRCGVTQQEGLPVPACCKLASLGREAARGLFIFGVHLQLLSGSFEDLASNQVARELKDLACQRVEGFS